jgi:nucleoside-diphosphate-sugar epimerase
MTTGDASRLAGAYSGVPVLVLGASGFIGLWVARALQSAGAIVHAGVRDAARFRSLADAWSIEATAHELDATQPGEAGRVLDVAQPVVVFNLVGYGVDRSETDDRRMRLLNTEWPRAVATAIAERPAASWSGQRLVHAGSALEYGLLDGIAGEDRTGQLHTAYGRTKREGTDMVREVAGSQDLPALTARLFTVFGAGEHEGRLLPTLIHAARSGTTVRLSAGTQRRDFTFVGDVARGLLALGVAAAGRGEVVNLASGRLYTVREFAEVAASLLGIPESRIQFGAEPTRSDEMQIEGVDNSRLRALTGWAPQADLSGALTRALSPDSRPGSLDG